MSKNKKIVITGSSSGLGSCLLKSFSKNYDIINISRSISVSDSNIIVNFNDLTALTKKLQAYNMKHDLCILNAGTMSGINCAHNISYLDFLEALKVNVIANKIIIDWSIPFFFIIKPFLSKERRKPSITIGITIGLYFFIM